MAELIWIDSVRLYPVPEIRCVVSPGLIPNKGTFVLFGPPATGKSWMFQQLGLEVDSGVDFMGFFATEQRAVIYYDLEMGPTASMSRLSKTQSYYPNAHRFAILDSSIKLDSSGGTEIMRKYVKEAQDKTGTPMLTLIDSIARAGDLGMVDEETVRRIIGNTKQIAEEEDTTFGYIGHSRKMKQYDYRGRPVTREISLEDLRSTMALAFDVDTTIAAVPTIGATDSIDLAVVKARHCPFPYQDMKYRARFDRKSGTFRIVVPKYDIVARKVIDNLKKKGPRYAQDIYRDLHLPAGEVKGSLDEMMEVWKCSLDDNGKYKLNY